MENETTLERAANALAPMVLALTLSACSSGVPTTTPQVASASAKSAEQAFVKPQKAKLTTLYTFQGTPDGSDPTGGVIVDASGNIFGTTFSGGTGGYGTVFELKPSGKGYTETVVHSFTNADGAGPYVNPIEDASGNLYVTTSAGGAYGGGTAVKLSPQGSGYQESAVYSFGNGTDGKKPTAALLLQGTTLYGTTSAGGKNNFGAIVELSTSNLSESDIYDFAGGADGATPESNLIADSSGALYGTTIDGGTTYCTDGCGTAYKFVPSGNGGTKTIIWSFVTVKFAGDGNHPFAGLTLDSGGTFHGTTESGGNQNKGNGTVFQITYYNGQYHESATAFGQGHTGGNPTQGIASVRSEGSGIFSSAIYTSPRNNVYHIPDKEDCSFAPYGYLYESGSSLYGTMNCSTDHGSVFALGV